MKKKPQKHTAGDKVFYTVIFSFLSFFFLIVLYPVIFVISSSFSSGIAVMASRVVLWPVDFSIEGYRVVFNTSAVWIGYRNSIFYTVSSIILSVSMTLTTAYCLSRNDVPGRSAIMLIFTFTMFFSGGLIPTYLLIRNLGMVDTPWVMIIPGSISVWNLVMAKTFLQHNIPTELMDAAKIDGCSDIAYYTRVVIPLSKAIIAVLVLFYGVSNWNSFFTPMIYLHNRNLYPLTIFLREILLATQIDITILEGMDIEAMEALMQLTEAAFVIKYALIVVSVVPVIAIYPFVQKYFIQGVMIGSIKG